MNHPSSSLHRQLAILGVALAPLAASAVRGARLVSLEQPAAGDAGHSIGHFDVSPWVTLAGGQSTRRASHEASTISASWVCVVHRLRRRGEASWSLALASGGEGPGGGLGTTPSWEHTRSRHARQMPCVVRRRGDSGLVRAPGAAPTLCGSDTRLAARRHVVLRQGFAREAARDLLPRDLHCANAPRDSVELEIARIAARARRAPRRPPRRRPGSRRTRPPRAAGTAPRPRGRSGGRARRARRPCARRCVTCTPPSGWAARSVGELALDVDGAGERVRAAREAHEEAVAAQLEHLAVVRRGAAAHDGVVAPHDVERRGVTEAAQQAREADDVAAQQRTPHPHLADAQGVDRGGSQARESASWSACRLLEQGACHAAAHAGAAAAANAGQAFVRDPGRRAARRPLYRTPDPTAVAPASRSGFAAGRPPLSWRRRHR